VRRAAAAIAVRRKVVTLDDFMDSSGQFEQSPHQLARAGMGLTVIPTASGSTSINDYIGMHHEKHIRVFA
jgi:hypothetical protein